ncbi:phenylalanine--tRNA ligase subunit beta [Candidatus Laterigemmans baculatus]|uniref:phenylalanine--tRNA ligase subunit beta n=1 Tax=Candidatus Laterigemmans baculatus TaxID=2770505 RepID=UPI0013D9119C|nr:phenylalanine--tRNA ligase subunit beta [Candidatus Laterigemmans baculatus]
MLVSWTWLSRYIDLADTPSNPGNPQKLGPDELADALSLSGLNHEETFTRGSEVVIDLEVTSNRGDCLGHIGVAREISVLFDRELRVPDPRPAESAPPVEQLVAVENQFVEACPRYTARVVRGVRVAPSPAWLADALTAVGITPVNNIVDITNYVMFECGQPLHAFDLSAVAGANEGAAKIIVRPAAKGERIEAIDHKTYELDPSMCVIADTERALAVAGVMGGAGSEVSESTTDLLIEAAIFTPLSVRRTARRLKLHSPSSFRFERRVDPLGVDWASRRVCELILEIAGGELCSGVVDTAPEIPATAPVTLRLSQIERILGISVPRDEVLRILTALGCRVEEAGEEASPAMTVVPPSWRHDLTREADLIEEVARIHGYDKIPEDSPIAVAPSARREFDHAMDRVRQVLTAAGISEAMTPSIVTEALDAQLTPWTDRPALRTQTPLLKGADRLRRSLLPSLLQSRAENWSAASLHAELFEVAHVYLPGESAATPAVEQYCVGLVSGKDFYAVKGIIATLAARLGIREPLAVTEEPIAGLDPNLAVRLRVGEHAIGCLGMLDSELTRRLKLPAATCVAELSLPALFAGAALVPQFRTVSPYPSISRDLNLIVGEAVRWDQLESSTRTAVGIELAGVDYRETYRAPEKDGPQTKRILFSVELQRQDGTLTGEEADAMVQAILQQCEQDHGAKLLA